MLLDLLEPLARDVAQQRFDDESLRRDWHYIPRRRGGLAFTDMEPRQQKAVYDLLATGVSLPAYAAAVTIIGLEDVLDEAEGKRGPRRGRSGRSWGRHRADYSVTIFGDPVAPSWGWRVEGHHLSVNVTVVDGRVAAAPVFLGANPAEVRAPSAAIVTRPLAGEEDLALELFAALDGRGRGSAWLGPDAPDDILTANAPSLREVPDVAGVRLGDLSGVAATTAVTLVRHYLGRLPPPEEARWWDRLEPAFGDIRFAFAGEAARRRPQYYRLAGPALFVEYDNTQDGANHVHTVLRDPAGDFGDDLLRAHRRLHH